MKFTLRAFREKSRKMENVLAETNYVVKREFEIKISHVTDIDCSTLLHSLMIMTYTDNDHVLLVPYA